MPLNQPQIQACQALKDILAGEQASELRDGVSFQDDDVCVILDGDELEDPDDEEYEDLGECEQEVIEERSDLITNPVQSCVLDLLVSLFTHLPSGKDDKFYSPIYRFVILFSLKKNGQWLAGRRITQLFAALLFCGRTIMMALMHNRIVQCSTQRYSE